MLEGKRRSGLVVGRWSLGRWQKNLGSPRCPTTNDERPARVLEVFDEGIRDFRPVIVGDARGRALHVLHQAIEVVA